MHPPPFPALRVPNSTDEAAEIFYNSSLKIALLSGWLFVLSVFRISKLTSVLQDGCIKTADSSLRTRGTKPADWCHPSIFHHVCLSSTPAVLGRRPAHTLLMGHTERQSTSLALCSQPPARSGHLRSNNLCGHFLWHHEGLKSKVLNFRGSVSGWKHWKLLLQRYYHY